MNDSIEKQLLDDIYKDFLVLQKERAYPQLYHSKYIYDLKRLSPKSKKECIFIWIDSYANYANNSKDMFEVSGCLLDLFTYLLNNVGQLSENELNQISSRLINSYTATSSWNWDHIPWVNSLFAHIKCIVNEGKNSFFDLPLLDVLQNKISYFFANPQLNDIINSIAFFKKGISEDIKYEIFEDKLYQYIDSIVENDINGLLFGDLFNYSKSEVDKSIPSRKWLIEAQSIIASRNNDEFENSVIGLFDELITLIEHEHSRKRVYCDFGIYLDPATEQSIRGLVWVSSLLNSKKLNSAVYELGLVCLKKKPGVGGLSTKIGNACIYVFSNMPEKEGMAYLVKYKNTLKLPSTLKIIEKYIAELAKKSGKSAYDLEDLACESYGLDDVHTYVQAFDAYVGKIKITNHDTIIVEWFNEKGVIQKSVPSFVKADFASDYKDFTRKTKDIKTSLRIQIQRLESFYLKDRQWKCADWKGLFLLHPLMGVLTKELIWYFEGKTQKETGFWNSNEWLNANQKPIEWIDDETVVRLWHPLGFEVDKVLKWRNFLQENQIVQPFKQAFREIYLLTEAELQTENYSNRFAAHILKNYQFGALCKVRNWLGYNQFHDGGFPTLEIKHHKISSSFWVEIIYEGDNAGTYTSTDQVRFYKNNQQMSLIDVPAIVFSEAMRDVDLFVGVCSIGNDPNWIDVGNRYGNYWQSYSFGEISESAKTRKVVLERLIPRLKIAKIAELTGNFLKVKGKLRTYKIHLGSGNILMEPNDQYLCIVPERAKIKDKVFLPFEGDSVLSIILSKAFLLADDDKVTDVTITRQIK